KTVNISDSYAGALGTLTATDSNPYASHAFTYSRTVSGSPATCTQYDNTATIVETAQTAGKTVTVCVGVDLTVSKTKTPGLARPLAGPAGRTSLRTDRRQAPPATRSGPRPTLSGRPSMSRTPSMAWRFPLASSPPPTPLHTQARPSRTRGPSWCRDPAA